jgi:hypothetical protein
MASDEIDSSIIANLLDWIDTHCWDENSGHELFRALDASGADLGGVSCSQASTPIWRIVLPASARVIIEIDTPSPLAENGLAVIPGPCVVYWTGAAGPFGRIDRVDLSVSFHSLIDRRKDASKSSLTRRCGVGSLDC